jgi:sulfofructose kinase
VSQREIRRRPVSLADFATHARGIRVICLGLSALDQIWRVDRLLADGGEKIRSSAYSAVGGGMAANASVAAARLGAVTSFWGRGGEDAAGHEMRDALACEGIDVKNFRLFPGGRSSASGILVDASGERQIVNFRGSFPVEADWLPLEDVVGASVVLADPRWPEGAVALFSKARAKGVPTILDADIADADVFERLLPLTDHAVFSEPALAAFLGSASDDRLLQITRYGCPVAAVTRGRTGVSWYEDGKLNRRDAYAVDVVDTTGAGDVFHGAYAFAIGSALGVADAMSFASAAAAIKCTRSSGRSGIPTFADYLAFMRTHQ